MGNKEPSSSQFHCRITVAKLCKFRPSDSFSPKRELQGFIQGLGSSNSLRRPRLELSEIASMTRSGEKSSPKRDVVVKSLLNAHSGEVGRLKQG
ncbi:hypothetical protein DEO72_LG5g2578 [Vigna unguiculata]|uniref:Uncharacterized protein n=1 Tax=Vigna unguiculata TaxID=3917 RepID=A0A4D6M361_VIGUN|nr:hypothetical protein DEO72_LG5g2578 [Vigna unguiculata]